MSSFGNNNNNQGWGNNNQGGPYPPQQQPAAQPPQHQGKEDAPNKIRFSSVKVGQTKQGSPTLGLYLRADQMVKLRNLLDELLKMNAEAKVGVIIINGKKYDSGYAYVNPKEPRADNGNGNQGQGQGQGNGWGNRSNGGGYGQRQNTGNDGREAARTFMQGKRLGNGEEEGSGN